MNFTGKVVLTSIVIYTKIFVCMYGFRTQLMTSPLMSTNRVTALELYIPFIKDYSYMYTVGPEHCIHLYGHVNTTFYDLYGIGWKTTLKYIISINDTFMFVRVSVCK